MKKQFLSVVAIFMVYISLHQAIAQSANHNIVSGNISHEFSVTNKVQQASLGKKVAVPANYVDVILIPIVDDSKTKSMKAQIAKINDKTQLEKYLSGIKGASINTTDSYGRFFFDKVPKGTYMLLTNSIAEKDTSFEFTVGNLAKAHLKLPSLTISN